MGRLRRSVEQQELWHRFVDKLVEQKIGEEAAPAARRDESGPITLFGTAAASRREPTGELGAAALDRAASEARAAADTIAVAKWSKNFPSPFIQLCAHFPKSNTHHDKNTDGDS